jgi:NAD(P)-dependent dehydrogenase (short-subunit alcohol dehydrogenase family)
VSIAGCRWYLPIDGRKGSPVLFDQIKQEKGKLDIIFANAGITPMTSLGNITEEAYDSLFNVNVKGLLFTVQNVLPLMPEGGSIILNASIAASKGIACLSVYSATKAAVRSFARTSTVDLKDRGIRVNALSPGYIDTAPWRSDRVAEIRANIMSSGTVPSGRFGTSDEVAKVAVFVSDDSSCVTGMELFVDGGVAQI